MWWQNLNRIRDGVGMGEREVGCLMRLGVQQAKGLLRCFDGILGWVEYLLVLG